MKSKWGWPSLERRHTDGEEPDGEAKNDEGKHVISDKPLCPALDELDQIARLAHALLAAAIYLALGQY